MHAGNQCNSNTSGKLRSVNTSAIHRVIWPHEYVFTPDGQPAAYESLSSMAFVTGFITIMDLQSEPLRKKMSTHLKKLMEDGETAGWPMVRAYHAVWLQHIEQGRATWEDETTRLKLRRSLVWHRMAPSSQPSSTPAITPQAPTLANHSFSRQGLHHRGALNV